MNNFTLKIKFQERLNKLSSQDYDNVECWQIAEAFNKAQIEWVRRQLHGANIFKEGDEQSTRRVDDLQRLLKQAPLLGVNKDLFFESKGIPKDYLQFKRVGITGKSDCCGPRPFVVYPAEEADVDELLRDKNTTPSFDWAETFSTFIDNNIRVYTNKEFLVNDAVLTYYRFPKEVQFINCMDPASGEIFGADQIPEFKDDIVELIIDEACSILAGDIESMLQLQRNSQNAERNN